MFCRARFEGSISCCSTSDSLAVSPVKRGAGPASHSAASPVFVRLRFSVFFLAIFVPYENDG